MAVSTLPPVLKSQPAVEKLNTFAGHTVTVTKHMTPRAVGGQSIVPTQQMGLKQLLELQTSLPVNYGPGHYYFNVVDTGGTGSDEWMVKLGPEQQEAPMAGPGTTIPFPGSPSNAPPAGEGVTHLGHGFYYNEIHQTLTTPWRTIVNWKAGDPMPTQPVSAQGGAAATPWAPQQGQPWWNNPQPSGWGGFPVNSSESDEVKLLRMQLEEQKRVNEASERRREADERQKREDDRERRQEERDRQRDLQFQQLVATLTAKPAGPDPAIEEMKRRTEALQQENERIRQETAQRERDANFRAELQAQNARFETMIRELSANKSDPMLTMLMQMMNQMNTSSMEAVKAIQTSQANSNSAAERQTQQLVAQLQGTQMTPLQLVQLMQQAKGETAEGTKILVDAMKESMSVQKSVFENLLAVAGQGDQPAWVGVVQGALDKIGGLGQAMMERNEREAARQTYQPPPQRVHQPAPPQQRPQIQQQQAPVRPPVTAVPSRVANKTPERPDGTKYDAQKDEFMLADGRRIPNSLVEKHGWGVVLADPEMNGMSQLPQSVPPVVVVEPMETGPMNGAAGHAEPAPPPPTPITRGRRPVSRKPPKTRRRQAPASDPKGYTVAELKEMEPDDIRVLTDQMDDQQFFGMLAAYVPQMRAANGGTPPPMEVAKYVKQAEAFVKNTPGATMPVAIELLYAEHLVVLAEKIFPGSDEQYIDDVAGAIAEAFGIEGDDDDEGESEEAGG